jgi:hypothetical protein
MAEHAAEKQSHLPATIGWGSLALMTVAFIWYISTQLGVEWAGRDQEALDLVRNYKGPGMQVKLQDQLIFVSENARKKGTFVGQFAWAATQDEGAMYKVELIWKDGSATQKALWLVNLEDQSIKPQGPDAAQFMKPIAADL